MDQVEASVRMYGEDAERILCNFYSLFVKLLRRFRKKAAAFFLI